MLLQNALLEQLNMRSIRQIFDTIASGYAEACVAKAGNSGTPASPDSRGRAVRLAMPALSPQVASAAYLPIYHIPSMIHIRWSSRNKRIIASTSQ